MKRNICITSQKLVEWRNFVACIYKLAVIIKKLHMRKIFLIITLLFFAKLSFADTISIERRLNNIENNVKQVETNQLNYKIERDLLKETYSNNYERINLVITIIFGIMGILGYLGLKDISSIKKEYEQELSNLKKLQGQFNSKSIEFDNEKTKFENELKLIIKENEEQNSKIKFIELKDKARTLLKDNSLAPALEFANAALNINSEDADLLNLKGRILCRLNLIKDAVDSFMLARKANPNDSITILNTAECLYFNNDIETAKKLIEEHKSLFENKEYGKLLDLLNIFELFHNNKKEELLAIAEGFVDFNNLKSKSDKISGWDFQEALFFIYHQQESEMKKITQNILWYLDSQITSETLLKRLDIELPIKTEDA